MRSPVLLLLLGLLLALTPGAEAGKLGKLLLWKHWGKSHGGHYGRSGGVAATKSGGWSGDSKSHGGDSSGGGMHHDDSKSHGGDSSGGGMHHGNSKSHGGDSGGGDSKSHGGDSSGGGMHHGNSKSHGGDSGGKHHGDMSHMDTDDDSDDSQDWWHSKSWRRESWWGKHMSRHGGWKMRTSGRTFGNGQGIRAAKCMLRECGMELQKCRFDMTCRQGVKCAVGEDPSRALSGFPRRVPSGLSAPVSSQPHVFPRRSLSLKPRKKTTHTFGYFRRRPSRKAADSAATTRAARARSTASSRTAATCPRSCSSASWCLDACPRCETDEVRPRRREKRRYDAATGWR
jgi:hypothetical protein